MERDIANDRAPTPGQVKNIALTLNTVSKTAAYSVLTSDSGTLSADAGQRVGDPADQSPIRWDALPVLAVAAQKRELLRAGPGLTK